jgi:hypothetical protein
MICNAELHLKHPYSPKVTQKPQLHICSVQFQCPSSYFYFFPVTWDKGNSATNEKGSTTSRNHDLVRCR